MRHHQGGAVELADSLNERRTKFRSGGRVDRCQRFVEQQQARTDGECSQQGHSLALSSTQFVWSACDQFRQTDGGDHLARTFARLGGADASGAQSEGHVLEHGQVVEEQVILEDESDVPSFGGHELVVLGGIEHQIVENDATRVDGDQSGDAPQQGGLTHSVGSDDGDGPAVVDRGVHTQRKIGEAHGEVEVQGHRRSPAPSQRSRMVTKTTNETPIIMTLSSIERPGSVSRDV